MNGLRKLINPHPVRHRWRSPADPHHKTLRPGARKRGPGGEDKKT
jgi:hypothetical protein